MTDHVHDWQVSDLGRAGVYVRQYRQQRNLNSIINRIGRGEVKAFLPSAVIVQNKKFPDGSFYQGLFDFDVLRSKTDAVIFRAGQNTWADPMFLRNYAEAKKRGMKRGAYWFYDDRADPGKQAAKLLGLIGDDLPEMEIFVDWENTYGGAFGGIKNVVAMMQAVERALPSAKVGIYTGYYWFIEHTNAITNYAQYQYLKDKPLWLGYYAAAENVKIPAPWFSLTHWQYGTPAEYWGQASYEIDMNFFNGTEQEFDNRYGGELPREEGETMAYQYEAVSAFRMSLRPAHDTNNAPIATIPAQSKMQGDTVWEDGVSEKWLEVKAVNGVTLAVSGWVAIEHEGRMYCTLTSNTPPVSTFPPEITLKIGTAEQVYVVKNVS